MLCVREGTQSALGAVRIVCRVPIFISYTCEEEWPVFLSDVCLERGGQMGLGVAGEADLTRRRVAGGRRTCASPRIRCPLNTAYNSQAAGKASTGARSASVASRSEPTAAPTTAAVAAADRATMRTNLSRARSPSTPRKAGPPQALARRVPKEEAWRGGGKHGRRGRERQRAAAHACSVEGPGCVGTSSGGPELVGGVGRERGGGKPCPPAPG
eukprot:scaffold4394_cov113-Isochrysis_galbana.AAC.14